ncbi:MAG: dipeptide transport system ATP-binding protein, partial [Pseudomonadota bacterium]
MSILQISQVSKTFSTHGAITQALTATDLTVEENDFITILGPSGCGKSTLARALTLIEKPSAGELWLAGEQVDTAHKPDAALRQRIQMVFQNPYGSLNPR